MMAEDRQMSGLRLPNTLELPPSHTAAMVGHFLKRIYEDSLETDYPRHLTILIEKIDMAERQSMKASER
ncbi:hypothetical protein MHY87_12495 [Microvirga sp. ACRRW]|uniref:hypothetical protein n=1 Tax=Microvirga sp. ACRRW TaxID=2918205 RepID=UPI001EF64A9A|nr:hypothetical protein [Microvirga sp. ACRRW]MCG7393728.1 hypothetical protein [Microvirga sp. ACRRW]